MTGHDAPESQGLARVSAWILDFSVFILRSCLYPHLRQRLVPTCECDPPGKRRDAFVQRHEVVFQIEVRQVVAVKQLSGQLLQAAARQVHRVHPLGRDLEGTGRTQR